MIASVSEMGTHSLLCLHSAESVLGEVLPYLRVSKVISGLVHELLVASLIRIDLLEAIYVKRNEGIRAGGLAVLYFSEIKDLYKYGKDCCASSNDAFIDVVLRNDEIDKKTHTEYIGVDLKEPKLHLVIDHLHPIVIVDILLIFYVQVDQAHED